MDGLYAQAEKLDGQACLWARLGELGGQDLALNRRFKGRLEWGKLGDKRGLTIFTFVIIKI
jgi:hypothetical protein